MSRYNVELNYEMAKSRAEKRSFEKLNWIDFEGDEKSTKSDRVIAELDEFIARLKQVDEVNTSESQITEINSKVCRRLFEIEMDSEQFKTSTIEVRENLSRHSAANNLGSLKTDDVIYSCFSIILYLS